MMASSVLTDAEREALLAQLESWRSWCDYPGDRSVLQALAYRLNVRNLSAGEALDAVIAARRAIGRLKPKCAQRGRVESTHRMTG